jgi:hypothetical protein
VPLETNAAGDELDISFVIPCLNEEKHIGETLRDIKRFIPAGLAAEVIVADHGSNDRTREIAAVHGAKVVCHPEVTLGDLRNCGARVAGGRVLVFVDADVSLTREWQENIGRVLASVQRGQRIVTGSRTEYAHADHWTHYGFGLQTAVQGEVRYLGTAHLIVERALFEQIGGFPADRDTGEDEAFGERARDMGVRVVADPGLRAIHRGAPGTTGEFFLRQLWHGLGDVSSMDRLLRSPTGMAGLGLVGVHLMIAAGLPPLRLVPPVAAAFGLVIGLGIVTIKVWVSRHALRARDLPAAYATFYLFFLARGLAPFARLFLSKGRRISARG